MGATGIYTVSCITRFLEQTSEKEHLNMKNFFQRSVKIRFIFKPVFVFLSQAIISHINSKNH
jgi:hypothetical protein